MDRRSNVNGASRPAIIRSRTGCLTCRRRRLKCDEGKPDCRACVRRSLHCDYGARFVFRDDTAFVARRATEVERAKWAAIREQDSQRHHPNSRNTNSRSSAAKRAPSPPAANSPCDFDSPFSPEAQRGDVSSSASLMSSHESEATHRRQTSGSPGDVWETTANGLDGNGSGVDYGDENHLTPDAVSEPIAALGDRSEFEAGDSFPAVSTPEPARGSGGASSHASGSDPSRTGHDVPRDEAPTNAGSYSSPAQLGAGHSGTPGLSSSSYTGSSIWTSGEASNESLATKDSPMFNFSFPSDASWFPSHCNTLAEGHQPRHWVTDMATSTAQSSHMWAEQTIQRDTGWDIADASTTADLAREAEHLSYWRRRLLPRLPSVFADIEPLISQNEVVKLAVLALSASRLTEWGVREPPTIRHFDQPSPSSAVPDNSESLAYYSRALMTFATSRLCGFAAMDTCAKIVALLLFSHMELTLGTMYGSYSHILKCDEVVRKDHDSVVQSPLGVRLVIEWAGLRARHAVDTPPFHPKFARAFAGSLIQAGIDRLIEVSSADFPFLMLRLSNSYYASDLLLFLQTVGSDATSPIYRTWRGLFARIGRQGPPECLTDESPTKLLAMLDTEKALLDEWHKRLPLSSLPVEGFCSADFEEFNTRVAGLRVRPLRFTTHRAAMRYLLYACAQMYTSRSNLERCGNGGADDMVAADGVARACHGTSCASPIDPWVLLMLRILAGLDVQACLAENTFECGATWIVARIALRCCSLEVLTWLNTWLLGLEKTGAAQEGALPIRLVRQAVAMIATEHERGRVVNLLFTSFDQFQEKQMLCSMTFEESRPKAIVHGTTRLRGEGSRRGCEVVPFVDVI